MLDKFNNLKVPGPTMTLISKPFWDAVAKHEFQLQKCSDCHKWVFYPRGHCPECWSDNLIWEIASGKGRLKTWSVVHKPGHSGWDEVTPYAIGLIELEEGPTMMSHLLIESDEDLIIDLPFEVSYMKCNDVWLPFFKKQIS
ncbi:OB-fold domain-containing protein [Bacillus sp. FJAT-49705]|uniref:OB-fold domain-containing protein n=1 Tax=Cytobacillus citreus TaxID=2833586 RepID=A0ABS5NNS2_9BACI|nr:OB-fold domain-containing protein [Cytobacillus citreus]MBS4189481.1 OB-fold domain-containing protein [Cytobacillus citreus]